MKTLYVTCFASLLAVACAPSIGADPAADEGAELRARADGLRAQRERDPSWDGGTRRVNETQRERRVSEVPKPSGGDVKLDQNRGEVKAKPAKSRKKSKSVTQRAKRSAMKLPGSLVR